MMCESDSEDRIIIPSAGALELVSKANNIFVRKCPCRVQNQNCPSNTWEVCLLFENAAKEDLKDARPISMDEALSILKMTAARKAIYSLFYRHNDRTVTEICSCCTCCCRPLNRIKAEGKYSDQLRSEFVAVTDAAVCVGCGICTDSCFFEARYVEDDLIRVKKEQCFGCGRCIEICPHGAITLAREIGRGIPLS